MIRVGSAEETNEEVTMETVRPLSDYSSGAERPRFDDSITQLIRSAERFISMQKFGFAREQLELAQTLDPRNSYISAIIERVKMAEGRIQGDRLTVSVGPEFRTGVKSNLDEPEIPPKELQAQIRHLTSVAEQFLEKGSYDNAFDSLMKAYLLDPVSPYVISCEKAVLPVWQRNHGIGTTGNPTTSSNNFQRKSSMSQSTHLDSSGSGSGLQSKLASHPEDQSKRLEALKLQKEMERRERERALWRQASSPPKTHETPVTPQANKAAGKPSDDDSRRDQGLFNKLKLGKFLNP